jgi:tRNA A-37 threonylcarbamoyl transferase component Bud32
MNIADRLRCLADVAKSTAEMHKLDLEHNDISDSNIMVVQEAGKAIACQLFDLGAATNASAGFKKDVDDVLHLVRRTCDGRSCGSAVNDMLEKNSNAGLSSHQISEILSKASLRGGSFLMRAPNREPM